MPMPPPPEDLSRLSLAEIARLAEERRLPPVEKWNPTHCGDSEMRIARDGTWFHQGSPIGRPAMVRLFSTILRREPDGGFVLVTPAEKLAIEVEDRKGMLAELSKRISDINTNITNMEARTGDDQQARIDMTVEIRDLKHLEKVIKSIKGVQGVIGVERTARA